MNPIARLLRFETTINLAIIFPVHIHNHARYVRYLTFRGKKMMKVNLTLSFFCAVAQWSD